MSQNEHSYGHMVPILVPYTNEEREDLTEAWYAKGVLLNMNYDGTLLYTDHSGVDHSEYGIQFTRERSDEHVNDLAKKHGIRVDEAKAQAYGCVWYNGADSDMSVMSLEDFLTATDQKAVDV